MTSNEFIVIHRRPIYALKQNHAKLFIRIDVQNQFVYKVSPLSVTYVALNVYAIALNSL